MLPGRSRLYLMLSVTVLLFGPASAQTPEQLRLVCDSPVVQKTLLDSLKGWQRQELEVEIEERCAQIDLSATPVHDAFDPSPEASHTDWVMDARYSPDGRMIVSASSDGTVGLWDAETGKLVRRIKAAEEYVWSGKPQRGRVRYANFVGDGTWIATAAWSTSVRLFDVETGNLVATLPTALHDRHPFPAVIAATRKGLVLIGGFNDSVATFDASTQSASYRLPGHGAEVKSITISETNGLLATGASHDSGPSRKRTGPHIQIWRLETGEKLAEFFPEGRRHHGGLAFSRDGTHLAVAVGGSVHIYSVADATVTQTINVHPMFQVFDVAFTPDGKGLITCRAHPILWDIATGQRLRHFGPFADLCHSVDVSPDGRFIVTTSKASDLRIWEIDSGTFHRRLGGSIPVPR